VERSVTGQLLQSGPVRSGPVRSAPDPEMSPVRSPGEQGKRISRSPTSGKGWRRRPHASRRAVSACNVHVIVKSTRNKHTITCLVYLSSYSSLDSSRFKSDCIRKCHPLQQIVLLVSGVKQFTQEQCSRTQVNKQVGKPRNIWREGS
jgi:hypothetical protein